MKYETQKLVNWIKSILNDHKVALKKLVNVTAAEVYDIKRREAIDFLESLPEIESHLCRGGYIQDKNGTPCCDGDKVIFTYYADCTNVPKKKGQLRWSPYHQFIIIVDNEEYDFMNNEIIEFEKAE